MKTTQETTACLQCNAPVSGPINRLVQDACGHKKCRSCLLEDEVRCSQCESENGVPPKRPKIESSFINNHTGVIQVNGGISVNGKPSDRVNSSDSISEVAVPGTSRKEEEFEEKVVVKEEVLVVKKASRSPIDIPKHIKVVSDPLSYHCTICDKSFVTKTHVKYHSFCNGGIKPYKCDVCQKEFILQAQLAVHSYKHKSSKPYSCAVCKKSFSARNKLVRHSVVHSEVKSHVCSMCGNAYRSKESLKIHSIIHKGEKPFPCKFCSAKFNNQSNLNKHVITHSKEKAHMCDQCGKRFKQKWALSVHRRSHSRVRPHQCPTCQKSFVNLKDLQRHNLIHGDSKLYSCSICSLSFRRTDNLRRHMKNAHPGKPGVVIKRAKNQSPPPVDNPNAINVITTASSGYNGCCSRAEEASLAPPKGPPPPPTLSLQRSDCRPKNCQVANSTAVDDEFDVDANSERSGDYVGATSVINGPIKLAFKTPAFKSSYNIHRDFDYVPTVQRPSTYSVVDSVNIYQKILSAKSTSSTPPPSQPHEVEPHHLRELRTSEEICQRILDPHYQEVPTAIHYETSFQNRKHAMIKNIKFKVPIQYTSSFKEDSISATSVIVNNSTKKEEEVVEVEGGTVEHWRRRTSQNLSLKN